VLAEQRTVLLSLATRETGRVDQQRSGLAVAGNGRDMQTQPGDADLREWT